MGKTAQPADFQFHIPLQIGNLLSELFWQEDCSCCFI